MPVNQNCGFDPLCDVPMSPKHDRDSLHVSLHGTPVRSLQTGSNGVSSHFTSVPAIFVKCAAYHDFPKDSTEFKQRCQAVGYLHDGELTDEQVRHIFEKAGWSIYSGPGTTTRCDVHADVPTHETHMARNAPIEPAVF